MISGYINSVPFSVYNCGEFVVTPVPEPSYYYIQWKPSHLSSGTFSINSRTYNLSAYGSGYFSGFGGVITNRAFQGNKNITYLETNATSVEWCAFMSCSSLISASLSKCTYLEWQAFFSCPSLQTVNLPKCTYLEEKAFTYCYSLRTVSLPVCTYIESNAFTGCSSLQSIVLPSCTYISEYAFTGCRNLSYIDLPVCSYIAYHAFTGLGSSIASFAMYLRSTSVCALEESKVFMNSPINERGYIYVPSSLVTAYKANSIWSYFKSRIFSIT